MDDKVHAKKKKIRQKSEKAAIARGAIVFFFQLR